MLRASEPQHRPEGQLNQKSDVAFGSADHLVHERLAAHPDGHLNMHKLAQNKVRSVQARHVEHKIRDLVPPDQGRFKEKFEKPTVPKLSLKSHTNDEQPSPQVQLLLQRMKRHGFADCYLFHRMDLNGDGIITLGEFKQGLRLLHIKLSPKELNTFFAHFDRDKSGRIDYRELQVALNGTNADGSICPKPAWKLYG